GRALVPRPRRAAGDPIVGRHARRGPAVRRHALLARALPRRGPLRHRHGHQPAGRRAAGRARSLSGSSTGRRPTLRRHAMPFAKRGPWGAVAVLVLLGLLVPGAAAQPKPVVVVQSGEAATLDWHMHCDKNAHEPDRQIFDTLLRRDLKPLKLEGNLAESWRLLTDTTWQFKLRRGIKFHNGEPFDAAAVKFSVERMLNPAQGAPGRTSIASIDHVDVVDPYTVNVVTKTPFPLLPVRMSPGHCGTVGILPPKYVAQVGDAAFAVKPVGTGPYRLVEWVNDERLVLDANKDYHRAAPAIERLVFRPVPELTTRVAALLSGQADLVSDVPPDQVAKIKASGVARVEVSTLGGFVIMVKMTNYLMPGPWQDARVRKAINYAIDLDTIIKTVLEGYGQPTWWRGAAQASLTATCSSTRSTASRRWRSTRTRRSTRSWRRRRARTIPSGAGRSISRRRRSSSRTRRSSRPTSRPTSSGSA